MTKYSQIADALLAWFELNRRDLPWREDRTAYGTWVSEIMLQQTRVTAVIPYFKRFLTLFPDISALAVSPQADVYKAWEGLGYYSRAANLQKGAKYCSDHFEGRLPNDYKQLLSIPGIGPYTAGAIASLAFGLPEPAVDGNVIRVFSRLFALRIFPQDIKAKIEVSTLVKDSFPEDRAGDFNEAVMDLGAAVCIPGNPSCDICPVSVYCEAFMLGIQKELPLRKPKKEVPVISYTIVVMRKGQQLFIRQRPDTGLLANLFEFPSYPGFLNPDELQEHLCRDYGILPVQIHSILTLGAASHTFSHLKWKMEGYLVDISENGKISMPLRVSEKLSQGGYYSIPTAKNLAFASAIRVYTSIVL